MSRPPKCRRIGFIPEVTYFKPAGIPLMALKEVCLSVEEAEAIRLKDLEGLEQEQGAERMNISRPTFQRILMSARQKMADALLSGKAIRIEGGSFEMDINRFKCLHGHEWEVPFETMISMPPRLCPTCSTPNIEPLLPTGFGKRGRECNRHRGRNRI
jgi:predicted DNA-binding protein (UPF0251 family)